MMKTLVALSVILMTSNGQILSQPPPHLSLVSPSAPRLWYPTFQTGGVSLRTDLGSCADDMIQASKNHESAGTILTQARRIQKWFTLVNKKKEKAATMFEEGLGALKFWTEDGAKCSDGRYEGSALNTLNGCSTTATSNCDASMIDSTILSGCKQDAEGIVEHYYDCLRVQKTCACFQSVWKPTCDKVAIEALYAQVKYVRGTCTKTEIAGSFSDCDKALKLAAGEIGYCARNSVDGIRAPWTLNHDDLTRVEEDEVVESRFAGLCSLNF